MAGGKKGWSLEDITRVARERRDDVAEFVFNRLVPRVRQRDIDALHAKLRRPLTDLQESLDRYSREYPLLRSLGAKNVVWIVLQAADTLHLAASLFNHEAVSPASKAKLACALAYFISPIDLLPEGIIGPIGYADDVLVVAWVIDSILNGQNEEEKRLVHHLWKGGDADLDRLRGLVKHFDVVRALRDFSRVTRKK